MLVCAAGFHMGGCGDSSIRFRPALIFQPSHVNMFLEGFQQVLNELNGSSHLKEAVKQWYHFFFGQLQLTSHIDTLHGVKITTVTNIILHCKLMLIYYWHLEVKIDSYHIASYNHSSFCGLSPCMHLKVLEAFREQYRQQSSGSPALLSQNQTSFMLDANADTEAVQLH